MSVEIICPYCGTLFKAKGELTAGERMDECPRCGETVETEFESEQISISKASL